jgi:O-antigen ligase
MRGGRSDRQTAPGAWARLRSLPPGSWLAFAGVACIYLFHALYGALKPETALIMGISWAVLLLLALLSRWGRRDLARAPAIALPALFFALTIAAAIWSLTPWVPGGPHPAWTYVGVRGSASIDPSATIIETIKLAGLACAFTFGLMVGGSDDRSRAVLKLIVYAGAILSAAGFVAVVSGAFEQVNPGRLELTFLTANTAGTVFGSLLVLAVASASGALRRSPSGSRDGPLSRAGGAIAAALVLLACLLATASRGALVSTAIALVVLLAWEAMASKGRRGWVALGGGVAAMGFIAVVFLAGEPVLARFLDVSDDIGGRTLMVTEHWRAFLSSPLNGYGLGTFDTINRMILTPQNFPVLWITRSAHNVYVQWLEEAGLFGALPMFLTIFTIIAAAALGAARRSRMKSWLRALIACNLVFLLHGLTDFALQTPSVAAFWSVLLGIQLGLSQSSSGRSG